MNLTELANLVKVSEYLKNLVQTSGLNRFNRNDEVALRKKLTELETKFVSEVLILDLTPDAATIQGAIREAKEKMLVSNKEQKSITTPDVNIDAKEFTTSLGNELRAVNLSSGEKVKAAKSKKEKTNEVVTSAPAVEEKREEVQIELPIAASPSPTAINQPYMEDESLAAMLAAEKQKVAVKKRKTS